MRAAQRLNQPACGQCRPEEEDTCPRVRLNAVLGRVRIRTSIKLHCAQAKIFWLREAILQVNPKYIPQDRRKDDLPVELAARQKACVGNEFARGFGRCGGELAPNNAGVNQILHSRVVGVDRSSM